MDGQTIEGPMDKLASHVKTNSTGKTLRKPNNFSGSVSLARLLAFDWLELTPTKLEFEVRTVAQFHLTSLRPLVQLGHDASLFDPN